VEWGEARGVRGRCYLPGCRANAIASLTWSSERRKENMGGQELVQLPMRSFTSTPRAQACVCVQQSGLRL
jgi:hypothetical protein